MADSKRKKFGRPIPQGDNGSARYQRAVNELRELINEEVTPDTEPHAEETNSSGTEDEASGSEALSADDSRIAPLTKDEVESRLHRHLDTKAVLQYEENLSGFLGADVRIRLLTLMPGTADDPLVGTLETVFLRDPGTFNALSYCWGAPDPKYMISISGHGLEVTANLKLALYRLRDEQTPINLWIDAICINQNDLDEKAHQVARMREIYAKAQQTVVWLGEEEDDSYLALRMCNRIFKTYGLTYLQRELGGEDSEALALMAELSQRTSDKFNLMDAIQDYFKEVGYRIAQGEEYTGPYRNIVYEACESDDQEETAESADNPPDSPDFNQRMATQLMIGLRPDTRVDDRIDDNKIQAAEKTTNNDGAEINGADAKPEKVPADADSIDGDANVREKYVFRQEEEEDQDQVDPPETDVSGNKDDGSEARGQSEDAVNANDEDGENDKDEDESEDEDKDEDEDGESSDGGDDDIDSEDDDDNDDNDDSEDDDEDDSDDDEDSNDEAGSKDEDDDDEMTPSTKEVVAFHKLLKRPWFRRVWIIQEATVSKDVYVQVGSETIGWWNFLFGYNISREIKTSTGRGPSYHQNIELMTQTRLALHAETFMDDQGHKHDLELLTLLARYRRYFATDARDKVFAFYGLTKTDLDLLDLKPNYRNSPGLVYLLVARALIESSSTLEMLSIPHGVSERASELPSWVPNWDDSGPKRWLLASDRSHTDLQPIAPGLRVFSAARASQADPRVFSGRRLRLQGYIIDTIEAIGPEIQAEENEVEQAVIMIDDDPNEEPELVLKSLKRFFTTFGKFSGMVMASKAFARLDDPDQAEYLAGEGKFASFARTMYADLDRDTVVTECEQWLHAMEKIQQMVQSVPSFDVEPTTENVFPIMMTALTALADTGPETLQVKQTSKCIHILDRRLARSVGGRLCLAPTEAELGDKICLLKGGRTPFVVRDAEHEAFELIGEAYVHGAMYGELWGEDTCHELVLV